MGDDPEMCYAWKILMDLTGFNLQQIRKFHATITQVVYIYAVAMLTLNCNVLKLRGGPNTLLFLIATAFVTTFISFDSFSMTK